MAAHGTGFWCFAGIGPGDILFVHVTHVLSAAREGPWCQSWAEGGVHLWKPHDGDSMRDGERVPVNLELLVHLVVLDGQVVVVEGIAACWGRSYFWGKLVEEHCPLECVIAGP